MQQALNLETVLKKVEDNSISSCYLVKKDGSVNPIGINYGVINLVINMASGASIIQSEEG